MLILRWFMSSVHVHYGLEECSGLYTCNTQKGLHLQSPASARGVILWLGVDGPPSLACVVQYYHRNAPDSNQTLCNIFCYRFNSGKI